MANGEYPYIGAVATSDRTIPFGTKVKIEDKEYVVCDRTAKWIHDKFGSTFDIYSEEPIEDLLKFGRKKLQVTIYE